MQICRSWLGDPAVNTCLCILACSNRLVTFTHVPGTVAKFIGGGKIAVQLKERRKSEKVSIPPLCVDTAGICNVSSDFSHPGLIHDAPAAGTCPRTAFARSATLGTLSAAIAETAVD